MHPKRKRPSSIRCAFESLEKRCLLATIQVTTFDDVVDANDGVTSLREAITMANSNSQDDVIVLGAGTYVLGIAGADENNNQTGDLDVLSDQGHSLTLSGVDRQQTTIDGNQLDRVLETHIRSHLQIENVTLAGGNAGTSSFANGRRGGAISALHSRLELDRVHITNNDTGAAGVGGGLSIAGGHTTLENTEISQNTARRTASAIFARNADIEIKLGDIHHNDVPRGADDVSNDTIVLYDSDVEIQQTKIDYNTGDGFPPRNDAAIYASNSQLELTNVRLLDNVPIAIKAENSNVVANALRSTGQDRGILAIGTRSDLDITNSHFFQSKIDFSGGLLQVANSSFRGWDAGVAVRSAGSDVLLKENLFQRTLAAIFVSTNTDVLIDGNVVTTDIPGRYGQSIHVHGDHVLIKDTVVSGLNRLISRVRGIDASGSLIQIANSKVQSAGGIMVRGSAEIVNTEFVDNQYFGNGGAIHWTGDDNDTLTIANSLFAENRAYATGSSQIGSQMYRQGGRGGVVYVASDATPSLQIISSTLVRNRSDQMGIVHATSSLNLDVHNSILWNNFSPLGYGGNLFHGAQNYDLTNNIVSDASDNRFDSTLGNFSSNPSFVDFFGNDFRLQIQFACHQRRRFSCTVGRQSRFGWRFRYRGTNSRLGSLGSRHR